MKKICIKCGAKFESPQGYSDKTLCDNCAAESIKSVVRERVCVDCGVHFMGYPRSLRCQPCNVAHRKKLSKEYKARAKAGKTRQLGSIGYCEKCGKEYVVTGGLQKYCAGCSEEATRENDRAKSREWNREHQYSNVRQKARKDSVAEIPCAICGKLFKPNDVSSTCSPECSEKLAKQNARNWETAHKNERNEYRRKQAASKLSSMTGSEIAEYRAKINARARENYKKRIAAMSKEELAEYRKKNNEKARKNHKKKNDKE